MLRPIVLFKDQALPIRLQAEFFVQQAADTAQTTKIAQIELKKRGYVNFIFLLKNFGFRFEKSQHRRFQLPFNLIG